MPRLISSLWRSVRSPVRRSVRVDFPWSTWPTTPMLTSGWPGTFIAPAPATRPRSTSVHARRSSGSTEDVGRHRVSADRLLLAHPGSDGMEADAAAQEEALPSRPGQVGPHRKSVFVAPSGDLKLIPRQADVQAVEVLPDLLADERVRVVTRDVLLVRLPGLRVGDDRLELRHRFPWREMRPCGAFT